MLGTTPLYKGVYEERPYDPNGNEPPGNNVRIRKLCGLGQQENRGPGWMWSVRVRDEMLGPLAWRDLIRAVGTFGPGSCIPDARRGLAVARLSLGSMPRWYRRVGQVSRGGGEKTWMFCGVFLTPYPDISYEGTKKARGKQTCKNSPEPRQVFAEQQVQGCFIFRKKTVDVYGNVLRS